MVFDVIAPASTANLGPGFDTLGLAISLYTRVRIEKKGHCGNIFNMNVPVKMNLVEMAMSAVCKSVCVSFDGYAVDVWSDIPVGSGLGSSAAAIVAGVRAMNMSLGMPLELSKEIEIAHRIEGHPDNILPAFLGGLVSAYMSGQRIMYRKLKWNMDADVLFVIPERKLSTEMARKILPKSYKLRDVVYNLQRLSLLVSSIIDGDVTVMKEAMKDKIHQNYRLSLIPEIQDLFYFLDDIDGVYGYALSGSGPTVLVLVKRGKAQEIGALSVDFLNSLHLSANYLSASVDGKGVRPLPDSSDNSRR